MGSMIKWSYQSLFYMPSPNVSSKNEQREYNVHFVNEVALAWRDTKVSTFGSSY